VTQKFCMFVFMAFEPKDPESKCVEVRVKLCADALSKVKDKQAEIYRTTGRVPHKGQVINFLLQGK
jgi:uncharacterized protein (DUF924 family)